MDKPFKHRINAGQVAVKNQVDFFHKQFAQVSSEWKEDDTRVTFADFAISEKIFAELRKSFPSDHYFSEESNPRDEVVKLKERYAWLLDPIDGTNNYALGLAHCGISLALLKNGVPVYGFIYDMGRRTLIQGGPGCGLFDGSRKVSIEPAIMDGNSLVGMHFPIDMENYERLQPLLLRCRIRSMGSGALNLAYSAIGILDGCIDFKIKVWDIAAAHALLSAGGGVFRFLDESVFPMQQFHVNQQFVPYYAGTQSFCDFAESLFTAGK